MLAMPRRQTSKISMSNDEINIKGASFGFMYLTATGERVTGTG